MTVNLFTLRGRGVWRCLYDPISSLLVTAGFDSAIKVHQLNMLSSKTSKRCTNAQEDMNGKMEIFTVHLPNSLGHVGLMDRYIRYFFISFIFAVYFKIYQHVF